MGKHGGVWHPGWDAQNGAFEVKAHTAFVAPGGQSWVEFLFLPSYVLVFEASTYYTGDTTLTRRSQAVPGERYA